MPHILLVDDDDAFRNMLRLTLEQMGHSVTEACNGRDALLLHAVHPADVVLTDIIMPEKEGLETILELRRAAHPAKIVAMSGGGRCSALDYLGLAKRFGALAVLEKPFSNSEMALAIESALGVQDAQA